MKVGVFAIGHTARGDDAVGHALVERLSDLDSPLVFRAHLADGAALLDVEAGRFDAWVIVDAFVGASPGALVEATGNALAKDALRPASTHTLAVPDALEIARALGALPPEVHVIGVVGHDFTLGAPLSRAVRAALDDAERALRRTVSALVAQPATEEPTHA